MEILHVEIPSQLASELHRLVESGWFKNEQEAIRLALTEFVRSNQFALIERFQREDIAWALAQRTQPEPQE